MIKEKIQNLVRVIQKILLIVSLSIVYIVGFGITLFLGVIFNCKLLRKKSSERNTFWCEAQGYDTNFEESLRQS